MAVAEHIRVTSEVSWARRAVRAAWSGVFMVLLVAVLFAAFMYAGLQVMGYRFYEVSSPSMVPTFDKGDVVAMKKTAPHDIKAGDIIVFTNPRFANPVVHRVARVQSNPDIRSVLKDKNGKVIKESTNYAPRTFFTKGDGNPVEDPESVSEQQVLGTERFVVPPPFNLIVTRLNRSTLFVLASGAIALYFVLECVDMGRILVRRRRASGIAGA